MAKKSSLRTSLRFLRSATVLESSFEFVRFHAGRLGRLVVVRNVKAAAVESQIWWVRPTCYASLTRSKMAHPDVMNGCGAHHPLARSGQVHTKKIRLPSCFTPKDFHPWPSGWRRRLRCPESFVGSITKGCKLFISWDRTEAVKGVG
ncbi:hypothetical protein MRB53_033233 [Persea americana]|uniref:Uncharacterized protein n=1 Tax=Persea americana TaxID=3435 RepID=A0ACC2KUN4_PERAE|nr:hypothetical protein MRB53_033233 [Persea americana]